MDKRRVVPLALLVLGIVLVGMGFLANMIRAGEYAACDACGMEVKRGDSGTFTIVTQDGVTHYGCCPVCALSIGVFYDDSNVKGRCLWCNKNIEATITDGNLTSYTPTNTSITMIFGKSCLNNKLTCSTYCAEQLKKTNQALAEFPTKTLQETVSIAKAKIPSFTINVKQLQTPELTYYVMIAGASLMVLSPVLYLVLNRRKQHE